MKAKILGGEGVFYGLSNDTEVCAAILSKRSYEELESAFRFLFDEPHPTNKPIQETYYKEMYEKVYAVNKNLASTIASIYDSVRYRHSIGGCCVEEEE